MGIRKYTFAIASLLLLLVTTAEARGSHIESPPITDRQSLVLYVRDCVDARLSEFIINYVGGYAGTNDDILYSCNLPHIYSKILQKSPDHTRVLYRLTYYPGTRIADAYKKNDPSTLSPDEYKLYRIAVQIIRQAKGMSNLRAELFFHDTICKYVSYYTKSATKGMPRHATALGAFLDRRANCQGYCDAFSMLCRMYGLNVDMQSGLTGKQRHVWNVVEHNGRWYAVDVTWDDNDAAQKKGIQFVSHKYFNAPAEIIRTTHTWEKINETKRIEPYLDENYFYLTQEVNDTTFGYFFSNPKDAVQFISDALIRNKKSIRVMAVRNDKRFDDVKLVNVVIDSNLVRARKAISYYNIYQKHGKYAFYSIEVKSSKN
ncbi:MAG: hypothetical protein IJU76_13640 [Desulfovibrionaceae bacterium]|nr:hypothetical protein [Desulfovibrionaceae bacterium]